MPDWKEVYLLRVQMKAIHETLDDLVADIDHVALVLDVKDFLGAGDGEISLEEVHNTLAALRIAIDLFALAFENFLKWSERNQK